MVRFEVMVDIRAPPQYVADWWLDYASDDPEMGQGMVKRDVDRVDANTVRLTTHSEFGGDVRTTMGTVTRTGPTSWHTTAHVSSAGRVVSTTQTSYTVTPSTEGSTLRAEFEFRGRSLPWRFVLSFAKYSLRSDRRRAFRSYARSIEAGFAAGEPAVGHRTDGAVIATPEVGAPR
jgi:hypothetical protein